MENTSTIHHVAASVDRRKAIHIMANSMFRQLMNSGYSHSHIIDFTSEMLQILTDSLRSPVIVDE